MPGVEGARPRALSLPAFARRASSVEVAELIVESCPRGPRPRRASGRGGRSRRLVVRRVAARPAQATRPMAGRAGGADQRTGSSHASRLKPSSIGDEQHVLAAEVLDERGEHLVAVHALRQVARRSFRYCSRIAVAAPGPSDSCSSAPGSRRTCTSDSPSSCLRSAVFAAGVASPLACARATTATASSRSISPVVTAPAGTCAAANANARSGSSAMPVPKRQHAEAKPDPVDERIDRHRVGGGLRLDVVAGEHDVEVLARRAADRHFGRRLASRAWRRTTSPALIVPTSLPSRRHGDCAGDHLLLSHRSSPSARRDGS